MRGIVGDKMSKHRWYGLLMTVRYDLIVVTSLRLMLNTNERNLFV